MAKSDDFITIKELLEIVKHKVDMLDISRSGQSATLQLIKDQLSVMNQKLDAHSASLVDIESKIDSYGDRYKINQHNIERVDTRLTSVEKSWISDRMKI